MKESQGLAQIYTMKRNKVTLNDIAREAGVSAMTVSRAIRGLPGVNKDIQKKITDLAVSMGYIPNRSLGDTTREQTSMTVGVVLPYLGNTIFSTILENIELVLSSYGYRTLLCCTFNNIIREFHDISALLERQVDGIIWAPLELNGSLSAAQIIQKQHCPLVFVDRTIPDCKTDAVLVDDFVGSLTLTRHLMDQGITKIAYVGPVQHSYVEEERRNGYLKAFEERGLSPRAEWMIKVKTKTSHPEIEAISRILQCQDRPDGIFCFNDTLTIGSEMELLNRGIKIPDDMALVGFSGTSEMQIARIPITGVFQDGPQLGKTAAEFLLKRMINRKIRLQPEVRIIKTRLETRQSSLRNNAAL